MTVPTATAARGVSADTPPLGKILTPRANRRRDVAPSHDQTSTDRKPKRLQAEKIRTIGQILNGLGHHSLSDQAVVLGLGRSTTWTLVKANHKASGLSASLINRMLVSPQLPHSVREVLLEYVEEKVAGLYGDNRNKIGRFMDRLATDSIASAQNSLRRRA